MKVVETKLNGVYILEYNSFNDDRGEFVKTIHHDTFVRNNLNCQFQESFYSVSRKDVIRGMHFQNVPNEHDKLVYVVMGKIIDVVIDLRNSSRTFGKYFTVELSQENRLGLFIEKGFGHGFLSLQENTIVEYHTTSSQNSESEGGIKWDSFGFKWPVTNPILSARDGSFPSFNFNQEYF